MDRILAAAVALKFLLQNVRVIAYSGHCAVIIKHDYQKTPISSVLQLRTCCIVIWIHEDMVIGLSGQKAWMQAVGRGMGYRQ